MKLITSSEELKGILNELQDNPIFYAFGENKENFHSSFWKWMFHDNAKETILTLTGIYEAEDLSDSSLKREQNAQKSRKEISDIEHKYKARYDVVITINDKKKYIIETKVKSFPTEEQLQRIRKSTNDKDDIKFFCIHLYPSDVLENLKDSLEGEWIFQDFESIAKRINVEKFSLNKRVYLEDYKKMLENLSSLFRLFSFNKIYPSYDFIWKNAKSQENDNLQEKLEEYKLWELFLHYRSKHFFYSLKKAINESEQVSDKIKKLLVYESSINNKKSTISIGYILQGDGDLVNYSLNEIDRRISKSNQSNAKIVGIQIEDEQFRQFVLSKKDSEKLFQNMEKEGFFEDCHDLQKNKLFCKYGDTFKYRYTKLQISDFDSILYRVVQYFNKVERLESNLLQI